MHYFTSSSKNTDIFDFIFLQGMLVIFEVIFSQKITPRNLRVSVFSTLTVELEQ